MIMNVKSYNTYYLPTDSGANPPYIGPVVLPILSLIIVSFPTEAADNPPDVILVDFLSLYPV